MVDIWGEWGRVSVVYTMKEEGKLRKNHTNPVSKFVFKFLNFH